MLWLNRKPSTTYGLPVGYRSEGAHLPSEKKLQTYICTVSEAEGHSTDWADQETEKDNATRSAQIISLEGKSRREINQVLEKSVKYQSVVDEAPEGMAVVQEGRLVLANPKMGSITGYSLESLIARPLADVIYHEDRAWVMDRFRRDPDFEQPPATMEFRVVSRSGRIKWILAKSVVVDWEGRPATLYTMQDVTKDKETWAALHEELKLLRHALAESKALVGLLSICSSCKKIRDDNGNWVAVERYLEDRSNVSFTHGICPTCKDEFLAELDRNPDLVERKRPKDDNNIL
jgi:PAS domain S-box-containing protein